jgi:hypothetical protein
LYPWELDVLTIGIDAAQRSAAVAWIGRTAEGEIVRGVESIGDIVEAQRIEHRFEALAQTLSFRRVVVAVEYPRWNAGAAQTVRAAANAYVRLARRAFPRRASVRRIDPNEWQAAYSFRSRGAGVDSKQYSTFVARTAYGWDVRNDHEADAALILEYARANPLGNPPKKSSRKR